MQLDFHYYATYCAAVLAGYGHDEALEISYSAQFVDDCSATFLSGIKAPRAAATTQMQSELINANTDFIGLQDITRIWASFHFLPRDLYANVDKGGRNYKRKYRLICGPNGSLVKDTAELAKGRSLQAQGLALHVIADTWAHSYFAGTPSLVINNTNYHFYELSKDGDKTREQEIRFNHNPLSPDDPETSFYTNSIFSTAESSVMNLGHGRAGHLPDYSYVRYKYLPAWGDYKEIIKDNPSDYYNAFCQMVYTMKYFRGEVSEFETDHYDTDSVGAYEREIRDILEKRRTDASEDWKAFGEKLSGHEIHGFDINRYTKEYLDAGKAGKDDTFEKDNSFGKDNTFLGKFIIAAMRQKSMVTNKIYKSGNLLAGISVEFSQKGFKGIKDYMKLVIEAERNSVNG